MAATAYPVNAVPLEGRQAGSYNTPSGNSSCVSNSTTPIATVTVTVTMTAPGPIATLAANGDSPSHVIDLNNTANSTSVDGKKGKKKHKHPMPKGKKGVFGKNATASAGSANGTDVSVREVQEDAAKKAKGGKKGKKGKGKKGKKGKKAQKGGKAAARQEVDLEASDSSDLNERFVDVIEARDLVAGLVTRYNDELEAREPEAEERDEVGEELVAAKKGGKKAKKGSKKGKGKKGKKGGKGGKAAVRAADASDIDPYAESPVAAREDAGEGNDLAAAKKKGDKKGKKAKKGKKGQKKGGKKSGAGAAA